MLAAMGTIREVDVDRYATTRVAEAMTTEIFQSSVKFMYVASQHRPVQTR